VKTGSGPAAVILTLRKQSNRLYRVYATVPIRGGKAGKGQENQKTCL